MSSVTARKITLNYDYNMLLDLLYFIVDELRAIKKNNESKRLKKDDRYKKNLLVKSLISVEYLKNEIYEYQENYNIRNIELNTQSTASPLNSMLDALQDELKELDQLSKNDEFVEYSLNRKYSLSKAISPLKTLANHLGNR